MTPKSNASLGNTFNNWRTLINLTVLSAYFYASMEWLFFATKPSSLSLLSPFEKLNVLFVTGGLIALLLSACLIILSIPSWLMKNPKWKILHYIPSAFILVITVLILFDNFTYTVFKFGVISTSGIFRAIYAVGFVFILWRMIRVIQRINQKYWKPASFLAIVLLTVSMAGITMTYLSNNPHSTRVSSTSAIDKPNILIIGGDGLSANFMTVYGYGQETTPFLEELAKTSLIAENAFNNASSTTGSTTSLLTGKYPIRVNVIRYPDILSGNDSFEHLPGILKRQGYQTAQIGTPYYVDAQRLNLLDGFDIVNNQSLHLSALNILRVILGNSPSMYFIQTIIERSSVRLLHIFFVREMNNPLVEVNDPKSRMTDDERTQQIIELLDQADRPLFIFAHYMDTHGPEFSSEQHIFYSGSSDQAEDWDRDLYKDALLSYDAHVKEIYEYLAASGKLDDTIIVIYTDHGYRYTINQRIPIMIHFPENTPSGIREHNVQVMDIPVTLLDYLGIPRPEWMSGISILDHEPPSDREIISVTSGSPKKIAPPFNQIKTVQMIVCSKWYTLNVQENTWKSGVVSGHTSKCDDEELPSDDQVRQRILDYLEENEFDTSSLH